MSAGDVRFQVFSFGFAAICFGACAGMTAVTGHWWAVAGSSAVALLQISVAAGAAARFRGQSA